MNPLSALGQAAGAVGHGISSAAQDVGNFFWKAQPTAQATPQMPGSPMSLKIQSPVPMTPLSNQTPPWLQTPVPQGQVVPHQIAPSMYEDTTNAIGQGMNTLTHLFGGQQAPTPQQLPIALRPTTQPSATPTPTGPTPFPGQNAFAQHMMNRFGGSSQHYNDLYKQAVTSPGWSGKFYGGAQGPVQTSPVPAPAGGGAVPNPNINPNITIPYSQGGMETLPPQLSQVLLNSFNDIGQATNSAQVLNHPESNSFIPTDPQENNHNNRGENASFRTNHVDATNSDGSIDRGLFRINSNTFNGVMAHPYWGNIARQKFGIQNWEDMNDPQKNANMAKIIYEQGGWGRWFAAPQQLRAQGAPNLAKLAAKK